MVEQRKSEGRDPEAPSIYMPRLVSIQSLKVPQVASNSKCDAEHLKGTSYYFQGVQVTTMTRLTRKIQDLL